MNRPLPDSWGKCSITYCGKVIWFDNPGMMAKALHLQMRGKKDTPTVFEEPELEGMPLLSPRKNYTVKYDSAHRGNGIHLIANKCLGPGEFHG